MRTAGWWMVCLLLASGCMPRERGVPETFALPHLLLTGCAEPTVDWPVVDRRATPAPGDRLELVLATGDVLLLHPPSPPTRDGRQSARIQGRIPDMPTTGRVLWYPPDGTAPKPLTRVRVIRNYRVLLTFDDGPAAGTDPFDGNPAGSPTLRVLDALDAFRHGPNRSRQGVAAAFFVLTTPDRFLFSHYHKAEVPDGQTLLRMTDERGHLLAAHWGGDYGTQMKYHTRRVFEPSYDATGDGRIDGQNALESDLTECIQTVQRHGNQHPRFVRPPVWKYRNLKNPEVERELLATYRRLGLTMVLTDAKYPDGGYDYYTRFRARKRNAFRQTLLHAMQYGDGDIVITMHDSNNETARHITRILEFILETADAAVVGGCAVDAGTRLVFVQSREEAAALLRNKTVYSMFPIWTPEPSGGEGTARGAFGSKGFATEWGAAVE